MRKAGLASATLCAVLSAPGCVPVKPEPSFAEQCLSAGYRPGSAEMGRCIEQMGHAYIAKAGAYAAAREARSSALINAGSALIDAAQPQVAPPVTHTYISNGKMTVCTTLGAVTTCN